jgi:hypothetical protein
VATGLDSRRGLFRMEIRWALYGYRVDAALDQALVAVESGKPPGGIDFESITTPVSPILEVVGCRNHLVPAMFFEQAGYPGTATAAPDDAKLDFRYHAPDPSG